MSLMECVVLFCLLMAVAAYTTQSSYCLFYKPNSRRYVSFMGSFLLIAVDLEKKTLKRIFRSEIIKKSELLLSAFLFVNNASLPYFEFKRLFFCLFD